MFSSPSNNTNFFGTLKSRDEELQYFHYEVKESRKFLCSVMLLLSILFLLVAFFDYRYFEDKSIFNEVFKIRFSIFLISIISIVGIATTKHRFLYYSYLTLFPIIFVFGYLLIISSQQDQGFSYQAMVILLIIFCTLAFPLLWLNSLLLNSTITLFFLLFSRTYIFTETTSSYIEVTIYFTISLIVMAVLQRRLNILRRNQYFIEKQLELLSNTDKLTGCYNRLWFDTAIKEFYHQFQNNPTQPFSIILYDLDDFKKINDTFGHMVGDTVLTQCSNVVKQTIRSDDCIIRWGGEEFIILLPNTKINEAVDLAERCRSLIQSTVFADKVSLTCSFGVAQSNINEHEELLIQRADSALYVAKKSGKNCVKH